MNIGAEVFSKTKATHTTRDIPIASFMHALLPALGRMKAKGRSAKTLSKNLPGAAVILRKTPTDVDFWGHVAVFVYLQCPYTFETFLILFLINLYQIVYL